MSKIGKAGMLLLAGLLAGNAWADRPGRYYHHPRSSVQFGVYLGGPWIYPPYYPYPVYAPRVYVPPLVVTPAPPPVYIEQQQAVPTLEPGYWYYCNEAQAYYPYVRQCPGSWQKVVPRDAQ